MDHRKFNSGVWKYKGIKCLVDGCGQKVEAKGYCYKHYKKSVRLKSRGIEVTQETLTNHISKNYFINKLPKVYKDRTGSNAWNWKGGKYLNCEGYWMVRIGIHKYMRQSRYMMENELGRKLSREEVVHHINGIRSDDRIENFMLFKCKGDHRRYHCKHPIPTVK